MSQRTTVRIRALRLPLFIGVLDHEREAKQDVVISVDMQVVIPDRPSEQGQDYVSYAPIVDHLQGLSESDRHIDLVEELADEIFRFLFADPRVTRVRVEVMKPEIFPYADGVGVEIERINPNLPTRTTQRH